MRQVLLAAAERHRGRSLQRDAYSLTELLIVMVILLLIMAAALPVAKRVLDENRVREASRQLNAYISLAKTRAVVTGRPAGVYFELTPPLGATDPPIIAMQPNRYIRQSTRMYLAEVPAPYAGSTTGAKARIMLWPKATMMATYQFCPLARSTNMMTPNDYDRDDINEMPILRSLIDEGEQFLVRFDYKGPWYKCIRGGNGSMVYTDSDSFYAVVQAVSMTVSLPETATGTTTPVAPGLNQGYTNSGYAYQILRSPRRVGNPLELTGGSCVDLNYSGLGVGGNEFLLANQTLAVMFTPAGGVTGIYADGVGPVTPTGTIHFLIGRTSKMPVTDPFAGTPATMFDINQSNLADGSSLWVSVGRTNGTASTSENVPAPGWSDYTTAGQSNYLIQARSIATGREQTGGR